MNGTIKRLLVDRAGDRRLAVRRRYAAVAGVLCATVSLCTLTSSIALEGAPAMTAIGLSAFGLLLACLCFVVPWDRVGVPMIELAPAAATVAVAVATTTIDPTYGFYLVMVAGFVAYTLRRPSVIGGHLALIALALIAPIAFEPEGTRKAVASALIFGPGVILVTAIAVYLRRSREARERAYREFAADAMALASRIRSRAGGGEPMPAPEWFEAPDPAMPLRNVGIAKAVKTPPANRAAPAVATVPAPRRPSMIAVAAAASVIAVVSTTVALTRDGGDQRLTTKAGRALVRQAPPPARVAEPAANERGADRHRRGQRAPTGGPAQAAGAEASALAAPAEVGDGGGSQPAPPATSSGAATPVPTRPQTGAPEPQIAEPTPVQQATPAAPVESALGAIEETVGPLVPELRP